MPNNVQIAANRFFAAPARLKCCLTDSFFSDGNSDAYISQPARDICKEDQINTTVMKRKCERTDTGGNTGIIPCILLDYPGHSWN